MVLSSHESTLRDIILEARRTKATVTGRNESREVDLDGAYRIQASLGTEHDALKGYKFGLISPAKQQQMNLETPLYGHIYADMLYSDVVPLSDFIQPRIEPEVALVLRDDISGDANAGQVWRAIGGFFLGVDILDSVWEGYKFTAAEVAADNTSGGGFILGPVLYSQMPQGMLRMYLDGALQCEGHLEALGDPVTSLMWLVEQVGQLHAGQVIFLGSPAASVPAKAGALELIDAQGNALIAKLI